MIDYLKARLRERSTWLGFLGIALMFAAPRLGLDYFTAKDALQPVMAGLFGMMVGHQEKPA